MGSTSSQEVSFFSGTLEGARDTDRVAIFVHGLGMNGGNHGRALVAGAQEGGWRLYFARCNLGSSGLGTFWTTLGGISSGGTRLAHEIREVIAAADAREVVLIGSSLGGLYCRYAAGLLWGGSESLCEAKPRALVTLASPHLGVRALFGDGSFKLSLGRSLTQTPADLMWDTDVLKDLAAGPFLKALARFGARIAYAPMVDDGIVAYPSAALTTKASQAFSASETALAADRLVDGSESAAAWCGDEACSFAAGEGEGKAAMIRSAAMALLTAGPWTIVDGRMNHRDMAGLHPVARDGTPNAACQAVAADLWQRLEAMQLSPSGGDTDAS